MDVGVAVLADLLDAFLVGQYLLSMLTVLRSKAELHGSLTGTRRLQTSWCELQQLLLRASSGGSIQVRSNRGRVRAGLDVNRTGQKE